MGYITHDAVVAVIAAYDDATESALVAFRDRVVGADTQRAGERFANLIVGPIPVVNGFRVWFFAPDGSKEGWGHSDQADEYRREFEAIAKGDRDTDGSGTGDVVHIRFGGDHGFEVGTQVWTTDPEAQLPATTVTHEPPEPK